MKMYEVTFWRRGAKDGTPLYRVTTQAINCIDAIKYAVQHLDIALATSGFDEPHISTITTIEIAS